MEVVSPSIGLTAEPEIYSETRKVVRLSVTTTDLPGRSSQLSDDDRIVTFRETIGSYYDCRGNSGTERNFTPDIINPFG